MSNIGFGNMQEKIDSFDWLVKNKSNLDRNIMALPSKEQRYMAVWFAYLFHKQERTETDFVILKYIHILVVAKMTAKFPILKLFKGFWSFLRKPDL